MLAGMHTGAPRSSSMHVCLCTWHPPRWLTHPVCPCPSASSPRPPQALQALSELPGGLSKLPAARFFATGEHAAPWPRRAFTVRGGKLLHSKACGAMDVSRVEPREYRNHRELEAWVVGEGLALCPHCAQDGF